MIDEKKLVEFIKSDDFIKTIIQSKDSLKDILIQLIEEQPKAGRWIPIKYRETTDDDGIDKEKFPLMLDCCLPDDDTEIIVCSKNGSVFADKFFNDDGCHLESGFDIIEDVSAWMPLPEPYQK